MNPGYYTSHLSDLLVKVVKVHFQNENYIKAKVEIYNKHNSIFYEKINVTLYKDRITHWRRV